MKYGTSEIYFIQKTPTKSPPNLKSSDESGSEIHETSVATSDHEGSPETEHGSSPDNQNNETSVEQATSYNEGSPDTETEYGSSPDNQNDDDNEYWWRRKKAKQKSTFW